jgi:hypothetical protein
VCEQCGHRAAALRRPKDGSRLCKECFFYLFEEEVHYTITEHALVRRGERVAIAASGGKGTCGRVGRGAGTGAPQFDARLRAQTRRCWRT